MEDQKWREGADVKCKLDMDIMQDIIQWWIIGIYWKYINLMTTFLQVQTTGAQIFRLWNAPFCDKEIVKKIDK